MNYNINLSVDYLKEIEKSVLCSLIVNFDENKIEESLRIINENDFYDKRNSIVYKAIVDLYENNEEINEFNVFLKNQILIDEEYYLDVIASTAQASITNNLKKIKEYSLQRQMIILAAKIKEGDFTQISKLQILQEKLDSIEKINDLRAIDEKFERLINSFDLDVEKIRNKKIEFLYDNFLMKNEITMIVARPGIGKSLLSMALCNMLLSTETIDRIIYLDGDNSETTVKQRNIHLIKEKFGNRLNYIIELGNKNFFDIIFELKKRNLNNLLIILDSIKNFIIGDRNSHKDVTELMSILKELRKNGASVIFLHHQNKLNKDFNSAFSGSSAFLEDVASAYELKKNEDKETYIFIPIKDRNSVSNYIAFKYNQDNTLTKVDVDYAMESNEDLEIKEEIIRFIASSNEKPKYSDILSSLIDSGYNKDKTNKIIQLGKDKYWKAIRIPRQNNKLVFELIYNPDSQDNLVNRGL